MLDLPLNSNVLIASNASRAPLEWLNKSNSRHGADDVREPVDGTTEWLPSRPEFTELLSENNKKIFWLLGNPGNGSLSTRNNRTWAGQRC